jgi:sugar lactone lactonase YvrE
VWDDPRKRLVWVDVARGEAWSATLNTHGFDPAQKLLRGDGLISAVRIAPDGTMTYAIGLSVVRVDPRGTSTLIGGIDLDPTRWQVNGLVVLPSGNVLAGTLSQDRSEAGALWLLNRDGCARLVAGVQAANGLAIDSAGAAVWHIDTYARTLTRYDVLEGRTIATHGTVLSRFETAPGRPDGVAVDLAGQLWVAMWDGRCVLRLSPDGEELDRVSVPVARPTCCTVVGGQRPLLVLTTARSPENGRLEGRVLTAQL